MNGATVPKEPAVETFLERLTALGCPWELSDRWACGQAAIGIFRPGDPGRLAYVSVWGQGPGMYYVELEAPAGAEEIYSTTSAQDGMVLTAGGCWACGLPTWGERGS